MDEHVVQATYQGGMHFVVNAGAYSVSMDYPLTTGGSVSGPKPMEMLLASLASCAGGSVAALLRRSGHIIQGLTITARGQRRSEHPTVFTKIELAFVFRDNVDSSVVSKVLRQAEEYVCPIWAMLRPSVEITSSFRIDKEHAAASN